ncbi:hypothetical protein GOP47_0016753 [Adiantum capillus-veneris]|uniref:Protein kinase domain-containing protein n=1 Tax=Adiantum capillus-veneris TaxID=13818 RepID=A0A9D4ZAL8_ADICA|nr:hypothetical protein GOP47_0016753 [Adiantum capillus-veneris]
MFSKFWWTTPVDHRANMCSHDINTDVQALLAFKDSVGTSNQNLLSWSSSAIASVCTAWFGVSCSNGSSPFPPQGNGSSPSSATERVISLRLPAKSLFGPIPSGTLGQLDAIETLSLRGNQLSGELPADLLYNCKSLRRLYLQSNNFTGALPANISDSWPLLLQLDLSFNGFSGPIPPSLSNTTRLKTLYLHNNSLSGPLPPIANSSLTFFSVANNNLSGPIPPSLSNFSADSFSGNGELCGFPSPTACTNITQEADFPSPAASPPATKPSPNPLPNSQGALPPTPAAQNHKLGRHAIIGIAVGAFGAALMASLLLYFVCGGKSKSGSSSRSKKRNQLDVNDVYRANTQAPRQSARDDDGNGGMKKAEMQRAGADQQKGGSRLVFMDRKGKPMFNLEELLRASAEVLGKGSLGTAYKAMVDDGMVVVVKRLREVMCENEDFKQRMETLGRLQHPNLVALRAYYFAKTEKLLVLDYMPHGSLSALLHGNKAKPLNWEGRLSVAGTVARAMAYLHSNNVVHGNLKSSNVLLATGADDGEEDTWKVADYGLVQLALFSPTSNVKLMGYIAPEISDMRSATAKADVYSYGVLLLELLTGKSPILTAFDDHTLDLPKWVHASLLRDPHLTKTPLCSPSPLFDPFLLKLDPFTHDDMLQLLHISLLCTSHSPSQRPSMLDIVSMIANLRKPAGFDPDSTDVDDLYSSGSLHHHHQ